MVIWPKKVEQGDHGWDQALALLKYLPIDTRRPDGFLASADDFLVRPKIWVEQRLVDAPYFAYTIRFAVSCSVLGQISVDSTAELDEFKRAVSEALVSEITVAETNLWKAHRRTQWLGWKGSTSKVPLAAEQLAEMEDLRAGVPHHAVVALKYYNAARVVIDSNRDKTQGGASSTCSHEEILSYLINAGLSKTLLAA